MGSVHRQSSYVNVGVVSQDSGSPSGAIRQGNVRRPVLHHMSVGNNEAIGVPDGARPTAMLAVGNSEFMDLAAAQNAHRHRFTYLVPAQQGKQVVQVAYWLLVQGHDSVA